MKARVSVIIPCYNHEIYIEECIRSVALQEYRDIEIIVIDDGSSDRSPKIVERLSKEIPLRWERQNNTGISSVLNKGITKYASGEFIAICASDDYWLPGKIAKQVAFMERNPAFGMCYGKVYELIGGNRFHSWDEDKYAGGFLFDKLFTNEFHMPAPTYLIRRNVYDIVGLYRPELALEDWYMNLMIAKRFEIGFVDDYLACYRRHDSNSGHNVTKILSEQRRIIEIFSDDQGYERAITAWERRCCQRLSKYIEFKGLASKMILRRWRSPDLADLKALVKILVFWKRTPKLWERFPR